MLYRPGFSLHNRILPLPRLILIRSGTVDYRLDEKQWRFMSGDMMLVPAYASRGWIADGNEPLTLSWFQYNAQPAGEELPGLLWSRSTAPESEAAAMERIGEIHAMYPEGHSLEAEGEMKAMLARFLVRAAPPEAAGPTASNPHQSELAVADAARWLVRHYASADAIAEAIRRSRLSANHFRLVFKQRMGVSPHRHLTQLRMRAARFHLHETQESVKEVAMRVGYSDAFHFSRTYRQFWGHPPTQDRNKG